MHSPIMKKTENKQINKKYNKPLLKIENSYKLTRMHKSMDVSTYYDNYVNFNHTRSCCKKCPSYNNNWSCPDFDFNVEDYWSRYQKIELILLKLTYDDDIIDKKYTEDEISTILHLSLFKEKKHLIKELYECEKEKDALLLSTGYCNLCSECSKLNDKPCRYPNHARNSIESVGGLIVKSAKEIFNENIEWIDTKRGIIPKNLMLMTALLY